MKRWVASARLQKPVIETEPKGPQLILINGPTAEWDLVENGVSALLSLEKAEKLKGIGTFAGSEKPIGYRFIEKQVLVWDLPKDFRKQIEVTQEDC